MSTVLLLKPRALAQVLDQANSNGVRSTILFNPDGSLVQFAGGSEKSAKIIAAVGSQLWLAYERVGGSIIGESENMHYIFLDCEHGRLVMTRIAHFILCTVALETVDFGILKTKTRALYDHLYGQLEQLDP
ncbi:ragulator complex protein LAMTOR2-like protein [Cladochytrium replicatum]|nr:ragulator complex protein LAMTOR2-like protein [Cladochytrium replicatum]